MSLNDPNDDRNRYRKERERVVDAVKDDRIPEDVGDALLAFGDHKDESSAKTTATRQLQYCRRCADMANSVGAPPMTEWDQGDFEAFYGRLKNAEVPDRFLRYVGPEGWGDGSLRNFKNGLKQFLVYLASRDNDDRAWTDDDSREWVDDIELGAPPKPKVDPHDLLAPDELSAMWSVIEGLRDRALFAIAYCTWQRNAVIRSFRLGDVEVYNGGVEGVIRIYEDALGRKGASGRKPLSWAVGPVTQWIEAHPRRDDPDAPLLCVTHDAGDAEVGAPLSTAESVNRRLRKWAKQAGLERDRWDTNYGRRQRTVRAHLLRYTGATRAAKSDVYSEPTVKKWGGWNQSSDQLDRYIQLTDDDVLASWARAHDINSDIFEAEHPEYGNCGRCEGPVEDWLPACPSCGHGLDEAAPVTSKSLDVRLGEALTTLARKDPDLAHRLIDAAEMAGD